MAKLEIELAEDVRELVRLQAQRAGVSEANVVESVVAHEMRSLDWPQIPIQDPDEWEKEFLAWTASLPRPIHLSNEEMRRVNMYDDDRG